MMRACFIHFNHNGPPRLIVFCTEVEKYDKASVFSSQ